MQKNVYELFERYQAFFVQGLKGEVDLDKLVSSYASAFIAASPAGVVVGQNDAQLKESITKGFAFYRDIGTKDLQLQSIRTTYIDQFHCLAHVNWKATYERKGKADIVIDFCVHYLIQLIDGTPKIFGWIAGDEQAELKKKGLIQI